MPVYRFGRFEVDAANRSLRAGGARVDLAFRHFEALLALIEAGGEVVSRDELHARLWPDAIVDDTSLNKTLSLLRKALDAHDPGTEYVETVPRRGYRLAAPVVPACAAPAAENARRRLTRFEQLAAVVLAAFLLIGSSWMAFERRATRRQVDELRAEGARQFAEREYFRAAEAYKRAIALDPGDGRPYCELAHVVHRMSDALMDPAPAIELARKGADLAPGCAECQGTLGFFLFYHGWQWESAEQRYDAALRLEPGNSAIRASYAFLLAATGRAAAAQQHADYGAEAEPLRAGRHAARAAILYLNGRYGEAIAAADRAIALDRRQTDAWEYRSRAQFLLGRLDEGVRSMIEERYKDRAAEVAAAVEQGGGEAGLRKLLAVTGGWKDRSAASWRRAAWFAALGEDAAALAELEEAVRIRNVNLMFVAADPLYRRLHADPRFETLLKTMGLAGTPASVTSRASM